MLAEVNPGLVEMNKYLIENEKLVEQCLGFELEYKQKFEKII